MEIATIINPTEFGIEVKKATEISQSFMPKIIEREGLEEVYKNILTKEIDEETCKEARECRLKLVKVRTGIASIHKAEKEFYLASGKYIDALKNKLTIPVEQMEERLLEVEKYFENKEKERLLLIKKDRESLIEPYGYDFSKVDLSAMDQSMFDMILEGAKKKHEEKLEAEAKEKAEAEAKAKAEAEERERIRIENEKLKAEAEAAKKREAELKAKAEEEARKQAEILKKEREEKARIEAELKAKEAAEKAAKEKAEAEEKARIKAEKDAAIKAAKAPDKEKLNKWVSSIMIGITPTVGADAHKLALDIHSKFDGFKKWAEKQINEL